MIRQYEGKRSYRLFVDWLVEEAYYLKIVLQLSQHIPHFTTLQKFTERITGTVLERIISSFIIVTKIGQLLFIGIDSSGFKATHASQYYTERAKPTRRRKYISKLSLTAADILQQIICTIKIRRAPPTRHDTIYRFSTTHNKDIRNLTIVSGYR